MSKDDALNASTCVVPSSRSPKAPLPPMRTLPPKLLAELLNVPRPKSWIVRPSNDAAPAHICAARPLLINRVPRALRVGARNTGGLLVKSDDKPTVAVVVQLGRKCGTEMRKCGVRRPIKYRGNFGFRGAVPPQF